MSIRLEIDHSRQESGKEKRQQQLEGWLKGETAQCPSDRSQHKSKLSFQTGAIFLSACKTSEYDETDRILSQGDKKIINYANSDGLTALHQASIDGDLQMIKYLVEKSADINVTDNEGWNCLHASASCGYVEIAKFLVEAGIHICEVTADGELASDVCIDDSPKMEKYLESLYAETDKDLEREKEEKEMFRDAVKYFYYYQDNGIKYKPEPVDELGASPLHVAASKGYTHVLRILLEAGFYIDRKDADGWTPLHAAAHWEQFECCKILAAYGASFVTKNSLAQKPIDVVNDDLADDFKDLQRNRFKKENLPLLPDLPPPSPTNALMLPDEPQTDNTDTDENTNTTDSAAYHPVKLVPLSITPQAPPQPKTEPVAATTTTTTPTEEQQPAEKKTRRHKYGVEDEQISLGDARSKFGEPIKQKQPRPKRVPSTTENLEDEKRKHMSQPVPNQLTNVEQKNKAKKRRESRRSTQGVTLDIVNDAKKLIEDAKNKDREKIKEREKMGSTGGSAGKPVEKLPSGYVPQSKRTDGTAGASGKNPQMEKLKMMNDLMKKQRHKGTSNAASATTTNTTATPAVLPVNNQPRRSPNAPSSPDTSPMEEMAPKLITPSTTTSAKSNGTVGDGGGSGDAGSGSRLARSSAQSKLHVPYPDHLSTIRHSPVPGEEAARHSSLSSSTTSNEPSTIKSQRNRADSESSRKQNVRKKRRNSKTSLDTPRYCRNMVSKMLERGFSIFLFLD